MIGPKDVEQAGFLLNRLVKRDRHLRRMARRFQTDCWRAYDRDIPEIPLAIDRYADAAAMYLYERPYEKDPADEEAWLGLMKEATAEALDLDPDLVFVKTRKRLGTDEQYERAGGPGTARVVTEGGLRFRVNLSAYLDTGLFMDHRQTRDMVRSLAAGREVLNLYCYTGSFSVYALAGGAARVTGVDLSNTYLAWALENLRLNGLPEERYASRREDARLFLEQAAAAGRRYGLIVLDPPTFSNSKGMEGFLDLNRQWPELTRLCASLLTDDGVLVFSTNSRELRFDPAELPGTLVKDIGAATVPEDFRHKPHRAWEIRRVP